MSLVFMKLASVGLGLVYLKSSTAKLKQPLQFYTAIQAYNVIKRDKLLAFIIPLLIAVELSLALLLLVTLYPVTAMVVGIGVQLFYVLLMMMTINQTFDKNCNCFTLHAPQQVSARSLIINMILLLSILFLYGLSVRME